MPARLSRLRDPFDHPEWLFEIMHDGFRGLAYIENGTPRIMSRNGNTFKSFAGLCAWLGPNVRFRNAILDGEIVCPGPDGAQNQQTLITWLDRLRGRPATDVVSVLMLLFSKTKSLRNWHTRQTKKNETKEPERSL